MSDRGQTVSEVRGAGLIRKRLRGGYRATVKGTWYLRDACGRHEDVRAEMSAQADEWAEGRMTKAGKREALVELVLLAWEKDRIGEAEALASLRAHGFDPLAPEQND